jgi:predicted nucleic acid-binding protein
MEKKQEISVEILANLVETNNLCLSNLVICEFAFILKRLKESDDKINKSIDILQPFVKQSKLIVTKRLIQILNTQKLFTNSFDCYHLAFAETLNCKELITFDSDFTKLKPISKIEITVLKIDE